MANGASRLFEVMKNTSEAMNTIPSQVISLTVKSVQPLVFIRDDRLEIPQEFCIFNKNLDANSFQVGDIVTAIVFNDGQQYFIEYNNNSEEGSANYNDLSNKPKINNVELIGNKSASDLGIIDLIYPVGTIYMSVNDIEPSLLFSGTTWEVWGTGKVPVGVDINDSDFDTVEESGGNKYENYTPRGSNTEVTLTAAQSGMPSHGHGFTQPTVNGGTCDITSSGGHSHTITTYYKTDNTTGGSSARNTDKNNYSGTRTNQNIIADNTGTHTHKVPNHTHSVSGGAVSDASGKNATSPHNHTFTGTQATISHLQPYITCYMWKRIS